MGGQHTHADAPPSSFNKPHSVCGSYLWIFKHVRVSRLQVPWLTIKRREAEMRDWEKEENVLKCKVAHHCSCHLYSGSLWDTNLFILFPISLPIHKVWGFSYHSVWWNVPIVPLWRLNSIKCQFEINCEKSNSKSNPKLLGRGRQSGGSESDRGEGIGGYWEDETRGKKRGELGGGFQDVLWCVLGKRRRSQSESVWEIRDWAAKQILFYSPCKTAILEEKCFIPAHFPPRAIGGTIHQHIVTCHTKFGWGRLMNPPFPSSQWAFLWVKN